MISPKLEEAIDKFIAAFDKWASDGEQIFGKPFDVMLSARDEILLVEPNTKGERTMQEDQIESGQWGILELMGRKVVAGLLTKDDWQGHSMIRVDVPATSAYPAYTQVYSPAAVYSITYVSREVAQLTAEQVKVNPVAVYVPELSSLTSLSQENARLREAVQELRQRTSAPALPEPDGEGEDDDEEDDTF